ncbi:uncharacterized protein J3R85_011127 [Psidium guajava]|nr:uncharacterized protein J3R85_011127 [Psidium guajava]
MPIAELFLGAFLQVLFDRLASRELLAFARREGIGKLLKKWEERLKRIDRVLDDAEEKQLTGNHDDVKSWLEGLRNLAYDIDDLLDEFTTKSAENESKAEPGCSKARSLLPSCCFRLSRCAFMFDCKMRSKIEEMDRRLQEIITLKDDLSLRENNGQQSTYSRLDRRPFTTNLQDPFFVSREDEKREILELLTAEEDESAGASLKVISIVGMGGLGKTALAQQVYHDARVTEYFDVKAWACVSHVFNEPAILKSILETTNCHFSCEGKTLNSLQEELVKTLSGKKFLVVLDDVWNVNYGEWTHFLKPFQKGGAKGSKIIITTRHRRVAKVARARFCNLEGLPQEACLTLFAIHVFGVENFDRHPELKEYAMRIVEKCEGLPLAVKTLAGLLISKDNLEDWEVVLKSEIWDLPEESNDILPALKLSYLHLPSNLRRCFAHCAIFPHDYEIERDELIHWWLAEGLLEGKERKDRWKAGLEFFDELVSRSLLQKSSSSESLFLMHDLVNDMAKSVAGATHFSSEEHEFQGDQNNSSFARHASFITTDFIVPKIFQIYHRMERLRSFISLRKQSGFPKSFLSQKVLCDLLLALKHLRVLSLSHYYIEEVPDCIGKLRHLRHLNLSHTLIKKLPESIVALYNLEALMLRGCHRLIELPKGMERLINLRFLDITNTPSLREMPLHLGNLVGLELLSKFVVRTKNGSRLKELKNLNNLREELCISDLHMVREAEDAKDANLHMKEGICRLTVQWSEDFENSRDEELEAKVLDFLCPHPNVKNLNIFYYGGPEFPSWLGSPSYVNIVCIRLHGCRRVEALPSLGQLSQLKEVYIEVLSAVVTVGSEFYGSKSPFPSLITLEFKDMPLWEDWSHYVGAEEVGVLFPRLEHLIVRDCPMLMGRLPSQPSSLTKLEINSCPRMDAPPSIISLPSLDELNFGGCNEGVLNSLVNLTSLTTLVIEDVAGLTWLSHGFTSSLIKLEKLEMKRCKELTCLWQDGDVVRDLTCLKRLAVDNCPGLLSFADGGGDIELPSSLETIELRSCFNLEKLPGKMHALSSLRGLMVEDCPKLVSFPETGIPTSMISLTIRNCEMLQALPMGSGTHPEESSSSTRNNHVDMTSCLQELRIEGCDSLPASTFSEGRFLPATLKTLEIGTCKGVESLAEINVDRLQSLQEISIKDCENLRSLPQDLRTLSNLNSLWVENCPALELECFPPLPPRISRFSLDGCPKIKSLPDELHRLTCLHSLTIGDCESITRFPDGGLPPQLQHLRVLRGMNMKQPVREWLTPLLTSLEDLAIGGGVGEREEEDLVLPLPSSLRFLGFHDMRNLERLSSTLPPSLRTLYLWDCPKLKELPQDGHGLPPSLEDLLILGCPILEERCREGTGCYWPLIRQIPRVMLSDTGPYESITN